MKSERANMRENLFITKESASMVSDYEKELTSIKIEHELITGSKTSGQATKFYNDMVDFIESYKFEEPEAARSFDFEDTKKSVDSDE